MNRDLDLDCCFCDHDSYDLCSACHQNHTTCRHPRHGPLRMLRVPSGPAFIDKLAATPGYELWKPARRTILPRSILRDSPLFDCHSCHKMVSQGMIYRMHASNPRRCDPCIVPANLALDCFLCGSFDLCEKCFGSGKRCARGHEMVSGLCAIDSSNAPDLLNNSPSKTPFDANYCYNCQAPANQGVFYRKRETDPTTSRIEKGPD